MINTKKIKLEETGQIDLNGGGAWFDSVFRSAARVQRYQYNVRAAHG